MHPALLLLKPFAPYLGIAAVAGGLWWWHSSVVGGLEDRLSASDKALSACINGRTVDRLNWEQSETAKLKQLLDAELEQMNVRIAQEKERADANARAAYRAKQTAKDRETALAALSAEFGKRIAACDTNDRARRMLDALATGASGTDRLPGAGLPGAQAPGAAPGRSDDRPD